MYARGLAYNYSFTEDNAEKLGIILLEILNLHKSKQELVRATKRRFKNDFKQSGINHANILPT